MHQGLIDLLDMEAPGGSSREVLQVAESAGPWLKGALGVAVLHRPPVCVLGIMAGGTFWHGSTLTLC